MERPSPGLAAQPPAEQQGWCAPAQRLPQRSVAREWSLEGVWQWIQQPLRQGQPLAAAAQRCRPWLIIGWHGSGRQSQGHRQVMQQSQRPLSPHGARMLLTLPFVH